MITVAAWMSFKVDTSRLAAPGLATAGLRVYLQSTCYQAGCMSKKSRESVCVCVCA